MTLIAYESGIRKAESPKLRIIITPRTLETPSIERDVLISDLTQEFQDLRLRRVEDLRELRDLIDEVLR